jgi:membrane protease YdiL (CAAX protease family)
MSLDRSRLDYLMAAHSWLPRALPYLLYVLLLPPIAWASDLQPGLYTPLYVIQCLLVAWLLWRYRHLTPELTIRFHWLALPVAAAVTAVWIIAGKLMVHAWPEALGQHDPSLFEQMSPRVRGVSLSLRLLGMTLLVPLFEELFVRSLLLRSLHRGKLVWVGLVQLACDLPLIGDWLIQSDLTADYAEKAQTHEPVFEVEFQQTPLGQLSVFGVAASTLIFAMGHHLRDWPAAIVCGVLFCLLLRVSARRGLGPVIWAHGLTNAFLFAYCVYMGDWQFL